MYLRDCAENGKELQISWRSSKDAA
jgi:hypothetical protein